MTHPPLYREILRQAWHLTWHHKISWVFGLFAAFLGTGGALEVLARHFNIIFHPQPWGLLWNGSWLAKFDIVGGLWAAALGLLLAGLVALLVFVIINSFSTLIQAAHQYSTGRKVEYHRLWQTARKDFWSVFTLVVFFKFLVLFFGALSVGPLWLVVAGRANAALLILYPLLFLISVAGVLISSFLLVYASASVLLEELPCGAAAFSAWRIFKKHWLISLEMALAIFLVNTLVGLLLILASAILGLPFLLVFLLAIFLQFPPLAGVAVFLGLFFIIILILWSASLLATFHVSSWTLLFKRMHRGTAVSKLTRLVNGFKKMIKKYVTAD